MAPQLNVEDLSYGFPGQGTLQKGVSFSVSVGELVWIQGKNGSGKSTLLRLILGQGRAITGSIQRNAKTTYLPQLDNISLHLPATLGDAYWLFCDDRKFESPLLKGLPTGWQDLAWKTASGGERKRCLLAATLHNPNPLVVLDEPFNHLDANSRQDLVQVLNGLLQKERSILIVSHAQDGLTPSKTVQLEGEDA